MRGIVEFSNHCRQNCLYCGLRRDNAKLTRYRMSPEAVFDCASEVKRLGFGTVVLQAGEDPGFPPEQVASLVEKIKAELGLAVTLSLGEWEKSTYTLWREAGADRYLIKLETADETNYSRLRPGKTRQARLDAIAALMDLGYETGSGLITGLPGQGEEQVLRGLELLAELKPDMASMGPFLPHPDTPLKNEQPGSIEDNLTAMAQARILMPKTHIPVTSALGLYGNEIRLAALEVGNVLMPSLTPRQVRENYAIYPGKNAGEQEPEERAENFIELLIRAGFSIPNGPGAAWRFEQNREPSKNG